MIDKLRKFVSHPWVSFIVAVVLLCAGLSEGWETFQDDLMNANLRAHHGIILYGFFAMLKSLPDVFDGLERIL